MSKKEEITLGRPIAFYPELAHRLGSIPAALLYQHLHFWSDKGQREDGFIYKSRKEIEQETALTTKQQRLAQTKLEQLGWIEVKKEMANGKPTNHYKVLMSLKMNIQPQKTAKSSHLSKGQMEHSAKRANGWCQKGKCITENTTENIYTSDTPPAVAGESEKKKGSQGKDLAEKKKPLPHWELALFYIGLVSETDAEPKPQQVKRHLRAAKDVLAAADGDLEQAKIAVALAYKHFREKKLDWTLETLLKHWSKIAGE